MAALTADLRRPGVRERSLMILGLPRSMTTVVHAYATQALGLSSPPWTYAGEFLNPDRSVLAGSPPGTRGGGRAYLTPNGSPTRFAAAVALCERLVTPEGECYKDVVQPFVVAHQLLELEQHTRHNTERVPATPAVLLITRDVAEVAAAMLARRWHYPRTAARMPGSAERQVVEGLLRADAVLRRLPAVQLNTADLLADSECLPAALHELYPSRDPLPKCELAPRPHRDRPTTASNDLKALVDEVRSAIGVGP